MRLTNKSVLCTDASLTTAEGCNEVVVFLACFG
jgi:hypothetical protein